MISERDNLHKALIAKGRRIPLRIFQMWTKLKCYYYNNI